MYPDGPSIAKKAPSGNHPQFSPMSTGGLHGEDAQKPPRTFVRGGGLGFDFSAHAFFNLIDQHIEVGFGALIAEQNGAMLVADLFVG